MTAPTLREAAKAFVTAVEGREMPFDLHKKVHAIMAALAQPDPPCAECERLRKELRDADEIYVSLGEAQRVDLERLATLQARCERLEGALEAWEKWKAASGIAWTNSALEDEARRLTALAREDSKP